jgi:hypothetical protein
MAMLERARPVELAGEPWPDVPSADPVVEVARQFVVNLKVAINGRSLRSVAKAVGVTHVTISRILDGRVWPDLATIARLEHGIGTPLWPGLVGGKFVPRVPKTPGQGEIEE